MSLSLREKISALVGDVAVDGSLAAVVTNEILAAIEAERPAIEAAERERLAKLASIRLVGSIPALGTNYHRDATRKALGVTDDKTR